MGAPIAGLRDVHAGGPPTRLRLLAPLRYLRIHNVEKARYDYIYPFLTTGVLWIGYLVMDPKPAVFGDGGLLHYTRDLLVMGVPFMVGALAAVAMGAPGPSLDKRTTGAELILDGSVLTLRQFVCYLLGYLCFVGMCTLAFSVAVDVMHPAVLTWTQGAIGFRHSLKSLSVLGLLVAWSSLTITIFWSLYFLTDVVNRPPLDDRRTIIPESTAYTNAE